MPLSIPHPSTDSQGPRMDRMKIIKRRLSMSLRSARPVDDSLSELAEQMALDEPSAAAAARDNGESNCAALTLTRSSAKFQ